MDKECICVKCVYNEKKESAILNIMENEETVTIHFESTFFQLKLTGKNYFEVLVKLRGELEKEGIKLLCKGCAKNVYPSGMISHMGMGRNAYTLFLGLPARMDSLVDIFNECSESEYASVLEQQVYFEQWIRSIECK